MHVGKVNAFTIPGLSLWFNSNDHLPPHFHAEPEGEGWEVIVKFLRSRGEMLEVRFGAGPSARDKKALLDEAEAHREELLKEWERKACARTPGPSR